MNTLALSTPDQDGTGWDLVVENGTLKVNSGGIALAQDVASAVRTFRGECWYDSTLGVPYFQNILGLRVSLQFLKQALVTAGLVVPDVASIKCFLTGPGSGREIGGQLQITSSSGQVSVVETGNLLGVAPWWVSAVSGDIAATPPMAGGSDFGPPDFGPPDFVQGDATATQTVLTGGGVPLTGGGKVLTQ
jgi:hypothetical protein